ncbi:MAG TPA: tripartite tricarboxylate transporter substrate binding protein [Alphaproteobacteria bacterium]
MTVLARLLAGGLAACMLVFVAFGPGPATAQTWPTRTVRFVVPFPAGGSADTLARLLGQKITEPLGQPVVVENKPGAGGNLGTDAVAKSAPDGYTFLMTPSSFASQPSLYANLGWDPVKDFTPVVLIASQPHMLEINLGVPANSLSELIALAKASPGTLNYASGGVGTTNHLAGELFKRMTGADIVHVPYRGNPLAVVDVLNGQVSMMFDFMITGLPHVKEGRLRALAVTGPHRSPQVPDLPTMIEAGLPGYEAVAWFAVLAPAGTPPGIVGKLNGQLNAALKQTDVLARLDQLGAEPMGGTPDDAAKLLASEIPKWDAVIKAANIKVE